MIEIGVDNGILVKIRGEDIAAGSRSLPTAACDQPAGRSTVVDTPNFGKVLITYRLGKSPRRHANLWFWTACHAELAQAPAEDAR